MAAVPPLDFPAVEGRPVTEAHTRHCRERGHAVHLVAGVPLGVCPRCGEVAAVTLTPAEHRRRWADLSPVARAYGRLWDVSRADTEDDLAVFGADPLRVEDARVEFEEAFPEWFASGEYADLPEHGAVTPPPAGVFEVVAEGVAE